MTDTILEVENVSCTYRESDKETEALKEVSLKVKEGEFISVIGASGCGKTTLLRLIAGLNKPGGGRILVGGKEISGHDDQIGYVFQQGSLFDWMTVEQNIAYGLKAGRVFKENKSRIPEFIEITGLHGFEKAYPHQISGGMAQRVAIARTLINNPKILLLDEPMGALDSFTRADLQDKILELKQLNRTTMILVTHDVDEAIYLSDRIVIMTPRPGRISEIMEIDMSHPRNRGSGEFLECRRRLLERFALAHVESLPEYVI